MVQVYNRDIEDAIFRVTKRDADIRIICHEKQGKQKSQKCKSIGPKEKFWWFSHI